MKLYVKLKRKWKIQSFQRRKKFLKNDFCHYLPAASYLWSLKWKVKNESINFGEVRQRRNELLQKQELFSIAVSANQNHSKKERNVLKVETWNETQSCYTWVRGHLFNFCRISRSKSSKSINILKKFIEQRLTKSPHHPQRASSDTASKHIQQRFENQTENWTLLRKCYESKLSKTISIVQHRNQARSTKSCAHRCRSAVHIAHLPTLVVKNIELPSKHMKQRSTTFFENVHWNRKACKRRNSELNIDAHRKQMKLIMKMLKSWGSFLSQKNVGQNSTEESISMHARQRVPGIHFTWTFIKKILG